MLSFCTCFVVALFAELILNAEMDPLDVTLQRRSSLGHVVALAAVELPAEVGSEIRLGPLQPDFRVLLYVARVLFLSVVL